MTFGLIDADTPSDAHTTTSFGDGSTWKLVFSDEFNVDGRTFYPGGTFLFTFIVQYLLISCYL